MNKCMVLNKINFPKDVKDLEPSDLGALGEEMRRIMIKTVSSNGGHLASSLGVVELTIALHRVFDSPRDKIIWDVGHQVYPHKLLTGRRENFHTLRCFDGISGFPDPFESSHDHFSAGHAGNSVSAATGMAVARDLAGDDYHVIAVIGDGSLGSGMALEALNHLGHLGTRLTVIINDNGMSISPSVGSMSRMLERIRREHYRDAGGAGAVTRSMNRIRNFAGAMGFRGAAWDLRPVMPEIWGTLGFNYIGPLDGHDVESLESNLRKAREFESRPTVFHIITTKGKGYEPAEKDSVRYHGISPDRGGGKAPTYTGIFSRSLLRLMEENDSVVAITAAMLNGTGLTEAAGRFPDRVFDVGICEQHAVTMAAGMATQGLVPVVALYSTFLQRSYDQIINDVCLQQLPVIFAIDRAGIVGDDGKTHNGVFDISFLRSIPNLVVCAPKDENELQNMLHTAAAAGRPVSIRYPRGRGEGVPVQAEPAELPIGRGELLREGGDLSIIAFGSAVYQSLDAAEQLAEAGIDCAVVNARFAKPLDEELILEQAQNTGRIVTVEENVTSGGFGSAVVEALARDGAASCRVECIGLPDAFIVHGPSEMLRARYDLDADGIVRRIKQTFPDLFFNVYDQKVENIS